MANSDVENGEYQYQNNSDTLAATLDAAIKNYTVGRYNEALNLLQGILQTSANSEVYLNTGNCLYKLNRFEEALEHWQKAIDLDSKNAQAYANIGNLYFKNQAVDKAITYWVMALVYRPEDAITCLNLGTAYRNKNMRFQAIKYFEKYLKYETDRNSEIYQQIQKNIRQSFDIANELLKQGVVSQSQNQLQNAANCYFKALANYPILSKPNMNLGAIFFKDSNLDAAIKYWKAAYHIEPTYEKLLLNLAVSYDMSQKFDYAYCFYNRYLNKVVYNHEEYENTNKRFKALQSYVDKNIFLAEEHLTLAQEALKACSFYDAIDEFENYITLKPERRDEFAPLIEKIKCYINPENAVIDECFKNGEALLASMKFQEAKPYFYRIMMLSSTDSLNYSRARGKYSTCESHQHDD